MGKFTVKPKINMLFKKFSPETFGALKIGLSSLIGLLSGYLPMIVIQKFIGSWGSKQGIFNEVNFIQIIQFIKVTLNLKNAVFLAPEECRPYIQLIINVLLQNVQ